MTAEATQMKGDYTGCAELGTAQKDSRLEDTRGPIQIFSESGSRKAGGRIIE